MSRFKHAGNDLHYEIYGEGSRNLVLMPGLLFPSRMHEPIATALADRGHRVITFDLLGHGESEKPRDMWRYSMPIFARQVVALLDHLKIDEAVIGGTSLGANTTLGSRFGAYSQQIQDLIARNCNTGDVTARTAPPVIATFDLMRDGSIRNLAILQGSGVKSLDFSVRRAIEGVTFPPLPQGYDHDSAKCEFTFELKK